MAQGQPWSTSSARYTSLAISIYVLYFLHDNIFATLTFFMHVLFTQLKETFMSHLAILHADSTRYI